MFCAIPTIPCIRDHSWWHIGTLQVAGDWTQIDSLWSLTCRNIGIVLGEEQIWATPVDVLRGQSWSCSEDYIWCQESGLAACKAGALTPIPSLQSKRLGHAAWGLGRLTDLSVTLLSNRGDPDKRQS